MKKEIRSVDLERGICQVTTIDERWYDRTEPDPETGLDRVVWRPSVTWICDYYPKGKGFEHWLKKNGDDADQIARIAGDRGFKVHRGVAKLNEGETVTMSDRFLNPSTQTEEDMSVDEYAAILSYAEWWHAEAEGKLRILAYEYTVWPEAEALAESAGLPAEVFQYAGTVDLKVQVIADMKVEKLVLPKGSIGIIDCKTSLDIYPSAEMQVSAYAKADGADWQAILQLNYRRNKTRKYKFTVVPDRFRLFLATRQIWANETAGVEPLQRDFPLQVRL